MKRPSHPDALPPLSSTRCPPRPLRIQDPRRRAADRTACRELEVVPHPLPHFEVILLIFSVEVPLLQRGAAPPPPRPLAPRNEVVVSARSATYRRRYINTRRGGSRSRRGRVERSRVPPGRRTVSSASLARRCGRRAPAGRGAPIFFGESSSSSSEAAAAASGGQKRKGGGGGQPLSRDQESPSP
jgi:hypothetical protein